MQTKNIKRHINRLLLDPNNYRFIDNAKYVEVKEENFSTPSIQQRTASFLRGKNNENIEDLINSFKTNGVLHQDPIQVRKWNDELYVVIEGNRRTATLKLLYEQLKNNEDVGVLTESDFKSLDIIEIDDDDSRQKLIAMGLNHIGGKKRWSPMNQSQLINDLITKEGMSEEEICRALGINKAFVNRCIRTLALINAYLESDYGDQFKTNMYSIFEEIVKSVPIKQWLDWDDHEKISRNVAHQEKIFNWISETEEEPEDEENNFVSSARFMQPIITKSAEIRELAKFISDKKAVEKMEESRSVTIGLLDSEALGENRLHNALKNIKMEIDNAIRFSDHLSANDTRMVERLRDRLNMLSLNRKPDFNAIKTSGNLQLFYQSDNSLFSSANIVSYRRINNLSIPDLRRINLFVGPNNSGKTSMLEAFYLMTCLNDILSFIELEKFRGKYSLDASFSSIARDIPAEIILKGEFNGVPVCEDIFKTDTEDYIDRTSYVATLEAKATVGEKRFESYCHLVENDSPALFYKEAARLCRSAFSSPFQHNPSLLQRAHASAVKYKRIPRLIDFIRTNIDNSIQNIELVDQNGEPRFIVSSTQLDNAIDITKYGEGLQRIFEIALLLAYCENGILCVDEIDSGIHVGLLRNFSTYIDLLAREFNVQLFISTHSKECVDAFANLESDSLMAFKMKFDKENNVDFRYIEGGKLKQLIANIDLDLR